MADNAERIKTMAAEWESLDQAINQSLGAASTAWLEGGQLDTHTMTTLSDELQHFILVTEESILKPDRSKGEKIVAECLNDEEPFFVFRARDIFTPMVLKHYIKLLEDYGPDDPDMQADIVRFINLLKDWQKKNVAEVRYPD